MQVLFLDETSHVFDIDKKAKGSSLLELVSILYNLFFLTDEGAKEPRNFVPDKPFQPGANVVKLLMAVIREY